jgi:SagB-type dehydrogenase family enzyme
MNHSLQLQLRASVRLIDDGDDVRIINTTARGRGLRSRQPGPGLRLLFAALQQGGQSAEQLVALATNNEPQVDTSQLYFLLASLDEKGLLQYALTQDGQLVAALVPVAPAFRFNSNVALDSGLLRLSRFACLRREGAAMLVESPLGYARLVLHDAGLSALPAVLATPRSMQQLVAALPSLAPGLLQTLLLLLVNAGLVFACDEAGLLAEDADPALRSWEFQDLLFHARTRAGRHENQMGGTFRFEDELPKSLTAALKAPMSQQRIVLERPAAEAEGPGFFAVLESRKSRRVPGAEPMTLGQLSAFLWHSARVKSHSPAGTHKPRSYEFTLRPCPSGGAMHELELYLTVSRCAGLEPGLYHYDPLAHQLEHLAELGAAQQALVYGAMKAAVLEQVPDVLITLAARFGRVAWKYESVAYALVQKNVGVLYQQMYLVATALTLAPCALGVGNCDTFAAATGLDYFTEPAVGEFILSAG